MNQEELIAEAEIGDAARKFVASDLGKTLLGMAHQDISDAQLGLEEVDPENPKAIRDLQNKAKVARNFESWLVELISKGENAITVWGQSKNAESQG